MTSLTSAMSEFLDSPRRQRRLLWISGTVFVVGLIVFLSVYLLRGRGSTNVPLSNIPAQVAPKEVKAPPAKAAFKVAREFIETAVLRKNLGAAYEIVGRELKGTMTKRQWEKGDIPVIGYPAENAKTTAFNVDWSYTNQLMLDVDLVAKPGSHVRPHLDFWLGLKRVGGKHGRWLVNYWVPNYRMPIPYGGPG